MKQYFAIITLIIMPVIVQAEDCLDDADCGWPNYCVPSTGFCQPTEENPGNCVDLADYDCVAVWEPVCGCDGNTYSNDCEANYQNYMGIDYWGVCEEDPQIGDECITEDGDMSYYDCDMQCVHIWTWDYWLGDEYCDDGNAFNGPDFDCPELGYDCGDCNEDWDGTDPLGFCGDDCTIPGDTNNDGEMNVLDIIQTVCFITGWPYCEGNLLCADIDNDGIVDVLDIVMMVNIILGNE